jgi:hypothetical protein
MKTGRRPRKQRHSEGVSEKTTGPRPVLRPSPRGGMLYASGVRGNRGGTGRPITHGRYSKIHKETLRTLAENMAAVENPLNMMPELAQLRAHYVDFINRYDDNNQALLAWYETQKPGYRGGTDDGVERPAVPRPAQIMDISYAHRLLSEITKIVKRIEDIRGRNAITRADFYRLMQQMADAVVREVETRLGDEDAIAIKSGIAQRWREIRLT